MESDNQGEGDNVEKFDIKLKSKPRDGVILQLHHTIRGANGESRRIRFSIGAFEDSHEKLACADNVGNIFVFDFADLKFWKLKSQGPCTAMVFVPHKLDTIAIANAKTFAINFVDSDTGEVNFTLPGHSAPVKHIAFSNNKLNNLLTASHIEAILWELRNYTKYFTLNTYSGAQIQQILFTPGGDYLVACFHNDTVQIWRHETMKSVKQIIPNELKHLKNVAFTMNGRAMAIAGLAPILILFSMDTWKAIRSLDLLKYKISGVQQLAFIPQMFDGGANKILAILSSDCILYFLDLDTHKIIYRINPESSGIRKFLVSPTGKYFLCILQLGEVNIYKTSHVMDLAQSSVEEPLKKELPCSSLTHKSVKEKHSPTKVQVEEKMRICMDSARLRRILMQYGEYPDKFRSIIWRSLLVTPRNKKAYSALLERGIHPAYKGIEKQFTIHSSITLKNLKRLLSCLAHWCPLFGVMKFLPSFVFPFVKVLQKDPLLLFESVATVLINNCQLWFEYAPFPPISILAMIENILAEHDQPLLDHFCGNGVTSQTYALKILETAFSEVLTCSEWLIIWDHILSNEPAFLLMAVVSYNIIQKNALKRLNSHEQLENFFHMQNPIDKKAFLKKAYILLNETPEEIHPRTFFNSFSALEKGSSYQQFTGYPKATICLKLAKNQRRKTQERRTLKELTTKAQTQEINKRCIEKNGSDNEAEDSSDNELEEYNKFIASIKGYKKKLSNNDQNIGDHCRNGIKEDLVESVMYPVTTHFLRNKEKDSKSSKKDSRVGGASSHCKSHKHCSDKQNNILEKEVERLIGSCSNSDESNE
ncbi:TBC1 domain family member 31 [Pararge aegeria]|uniref:TBC1 domain family member 31 n=1 Tax=Pararge aegeria aegeria TaxID=348720 RepID=A0A8S4QSX1_9NEOP|nr:TBC1 domain family member 31 [Pararge aegeria]CAH2218648.1 jg13609 [Pararge aegeria aegeria]